MKRTIATVLLSICAFTVVFADGDSHFADGVDAYNAGDYHGAGKAFDEAAALYSSAGDLYTESHMYALLWAGASNHHVQRYRTAVARYDGALKIAEAREDLEAKKNILSSLANAYYALEDFAQSELIYLDLLSMTHDDSYEERYSILQFLGYLNIMMGDFTDSLRYYEETYRHVTDTAEPFEVAAIRGMLGYANYSLGQTHRALDEYREAVTLMRPYGPRVETVQYLGWIGLILFEWAEHQKAISSYLESYQMARSIGERAEEARMLGQLGYASGELGDPEAAVFYYERSLEVALSIGQDDFAASALDSLGQLYGQLGENGKAHDAYIERAGMSTDVERARALNLAGTYSFSSGLYDQARDEFSNALQLFRELEMDSDVLTVLYNLGSAASRSGDDVLAVDSLVEAAKLSAETGSIDDSVEAVRALTDLYQDTGRRAEHIGSNIRLIELLERRGLDAELAILLNNTGVLYYESAEYQEAVDYYRRALVISENLGNPDEISAHLHNLSQSLAALGRFDEALDGYTRALAIARKSGNRSNEANLLNSIGEVYRGWRWYTKALEYYAESEEIYSELGDRPPLASVFNNRGMALRAMERRDDALEQFTMAYDLFVDFGDSEGQAVALSNIGEIYRDQGDYDEARARYRAALAIDRALENPRGVAIRRNNLALIDLIQGNYSAAKEQLLGVLESVRRTGQPAETARIHNNLGEVYFYTGDFARAAIHFSNAIEIKERLRETAKGAVRREYLSSEIDSYNNLAVTYFHLGQLSKSLETIELSSAKYLREQIGSNSLVQDIAVRPIDYYQERLDGETVVITVTQTDLLYLQVVGFDREQIFSLLTADIEARVDEIYDSYGRTLTRRVSDPSVRSMDGVLEFYRYLLSKPLLSRRENEALSTIGSHLYDMLLAPIEEHIEHADNLIIIPSGRLSFVPFETFRMPDGAYLVEKYTVRYANSLAVSDLIDQRAYGSARKPLVAFGGAVYDEEAYKLDRTRGEVLLSELVSRAAEAADDDQSVRGPLAELGYGSWQNLPGTYAEVKAIEKIVPETVVFTGAMVSEGHLKRLSQSGELAEYRVLHFATHGLTVAELPELSSVVLSQFAQEQKEDGYLTVREIAEMELRADFVNLSACETGLGKLYAGEGVVGLTQGFLIAGANGLSVSLWQVADTSTSEFMTGMYRAALNGELSYYEAMAKMKRVFIDSETYSHPFYWAPFVYYGN